MSEHGQTLCDVDASDDEAETLKQRLQAWLVDKRIIEPDITNCVLSDAGGHRPAENYGYAIYGSDAGPLTPPGLRVNGLEITVGRHIYWGGDLEAVICPHCRHRESMTPREEGRWDTAFSGALDEWMAGGAGLGPCVKCGSLNGLNDWDWGYPWAFGALGVKVWNWDELSSDFIAEVSEVLGGHRVIHCSYKL